MICCFVPPHLLGTLARHQGEARITLFHDDRTRRIRAASGDVLFPGRKNTVQIFDSQEKLVIGKKPADLVKDETAKQAKEFADVTMKFLRDKLGRKGVNDHNSQLDVHIHFGKRFMNAFWTGRELVLGDGDGRLFGSMAASIDVVAHEIAHGIVQHTAGLEYRGESGALNEHFADVIGTAVQQAYDSSEDWLIGDEVTGPELFGEALRSMRAPGMAYDSPIMGKDPQPAHMKHAYQGLGDNGGVHINSGIMNRVFYLAATEIGTEGATLIWYEALKALWPQAGFDDASAVLIASARKLADKGTAPRQAASTVRLALASVGL